MVYLLLMPIMLWPSCGWATPVLSLISAFLLLGVENIGAQIEEPFSVRKGWVGNTHVCGCVRGCVSGEGEWVEGRQSNTVCLLIPSSMRVEAEGASPPSPNLWLRWAAPLLALRVWFGDISPWL